MRRTYVLSHARWVRFQLVCVCLYICSSIIRLLCFFFINKYSLLSAYTKKNCATKTCVSISIANTSPNFNERKWNKYLQIPGRWWWWSNIERRRKKPVSRSAKKKKTKWNKTHTYPMKGRLGGDSTTVGAHSVDTMQSAARRLLDSSLTVFAVLYNKMIIKSKPFWHGASATYFLFIFHGTGCRSGISLNPLKF